MAIRQNTSGRVGGEPEKLLTLEEASRRLGVTTDAVEELILERKLTSFRLGGNLLRLRLQEVETLRSEREKRRSRKLSVLERIREFFYFNDFYLIAFLILLTFLAIILNL